MSQSKSKLSRRTLFAGAGTVGALAATATLLPAVHDAAQSQATPKQPPTRGGGYELSEHVKQYYKTTRI